MRTLAEAELVAMGVDLANPFATTPRTTGDPFIARIGNDRLMRANDGVVTLMHGWYAQFWVESRDVARKQIEALGAMPTDEINSTTEDL